MPLSEVIQQVKSLNTRRNLTKTQKALVAARQYFTDTSCEQKSIYESWGVSKPDFAAAKYLIVNRLGFADLLFGGKKVPLGNGRDSSSVRTVADFIKAETENLRATMPNVVPVMDDPGSTIKTQAGRESYANAIKAIGQGDHAAYSYDGASVRAFLAAIADQFTAPP